MPIFTLDKSISIKNSVKTIPDVCFLWWNYYLLSNKCTEEWLTRLFAWFLLFQANMTTKVGTIWNVLMDWNLQTLKTKVVLTIIYCALYKLWCKSNKSSIWSYPVAAAPKYEVHHMHSLNVYTHRSHWRNLVAGHLPETEDKGVFGKQKNCNTKLCSTYMYIHTYMYLSISIYV